MSVGCLHLCHLLRFLRCSSFPVCSRCPSFSYFSQLSFIARPFFFRGLCVLIQKSIHAKTPTNWGQRIEANGLRTNAIMLGCALAVAIVSVLLSYGFPLCLFLRLSYGFPMVSQWASYGFPMVSLWFPYGCPARLAHGFPMGVLWVCLWFPMVCLWVPYGFPTVPSGIALGVSMVVLWWPYGCPMVSYGFHMVVPVAFLWCPYVVPTICLWIPDLSYCCSHVCFLWLSHVVPTVSLWFPYGFPMALVWLPYGVPRSCLRSPYGWLMDSPRFAYGGLRAPPGVPMVAIIALRTSSVCLGVPACTWFSFVLARWFMEENAWTATHGGQLAEANSLMMSKTMMND